MFQDLKDRYPRRGRLSLLTPAPSDDASCSPGEGWFFYWRVAPSLWKTKLNLIPSRQPVIIPINWAFHTDDGYQYDFGARRPEANLAMLANLCRESGRSCLLFVPLGPLPFLVNGGLPSAVVDSPSQSELGIINACVTGQGEIHKMYSFYAPKVFQCYARFLNELGKYLSSNGVSAPVYGIECGYYNNKKFVPFHFDRSASFENSFRKYVVIKEEEEGAQKTRKEWIEPFEKTIMGLYQQECQKALAGFWEGNIRVAMLGGSTQDFLARISPNATKRDQHYLEQLLRSNSEHVLPSSLLLSTTEKQGILQHALETLVDVNTLINSGRDNEQYVLRPLQWFYLIDEKEESVAWEKCGLHSFLETNYPWSFCHIMPNQIDNDQDNGNQSYLFVSGAMIDSKMLSRLLKAFLSGKSLIIDSENLSSEMLRKIQFFRDENDLVTEEVRINCAVSCTSLGDAKMIILEGAELKQMGRDKTNEFWQKLVATIYNRTIKVDANQGVLQYWRSRPSTGIELKFEEVRRLSLFNPTSYKKKFSVLNPKWAYLSKIIDQEHCELDHRQHEIHGTLSPGGHISLDFGIGS
jgi:hypothetical protein